MKWQTVLIIERHFEQGERIYTILKKKSGGVSHE